jgi:hypothetical protein
MQLLVRRNMQLLAHMLLPARNSIARQNQKSARLKKSIVNIYGDIIKARTGKWYGLFCGKILPVYPYIYFLQLIYHIFIDMP